MKKQPVIVVLITVFFLIVFANCKQELKDENMPVTTISEVAMELYEKAIDATEQVELDKANMLFKKAIEEDPEFFMAYYQLAIFRLYFEDIEGFKKYAEKAGRIEAGLSEGEDLLKEMLNKFLKNQNADVSAIGKELVELYPNDIATYNCLSLCQFLIEDYDGAVQTISSAIEISDNPAPLYNSLGYAYMALKKHDEASDALNKYLELEPNQPNPYDSKGDYYMNVKSYREAYESFMKAYEIDNSWTDSYDKAIKAMFLFDSLQVEK